MIIIRPADYNLLGIYWLGDYYFDRCLQVPVRLLRPLVVQWIAQTKLGIRFMLHLLDDFLLFLDLMSSVPESYLFSWNFSPA